MSQITRDSSPELQKIDSSKINWSKVAQQWCDRQDGIGADGLLLLSRHDNFKLEMQLFNQDGSRAEMSGNGIRCLAQAAFDADGHEESVSYTVLTDAGLRVVDVEPVSQDEVRASVDMGKIEEIRPPQNWLSIGSDPNRPVMHLSVGNPHSVVGVEDVAIVNLLEIGQKIPQVNLEIIEPGPESHAITMRVHERGAGITQACGTGACASAWAASKWGLVPASVREVLVHQPGGDASVRLNHPQAGHVTLIGPANFSSRHNLELVL
jgi:diaminopimelate epimerase